MESVYDHGIYAHADFFMWTASRSFLAPIEYLVTPGEIAIFRNRRCCMVLDFELIASMQRISDAEFFNEKARLGGRTFLHRPYFFNDPSYSGLLEHVEFGPTIVIANRTKEYCLILSVEEDDPAVLISPELIEEFMVLVEYRMGRLEEKDK
jgi:hypothetical protein